MLMVDCVIGNWFDISAKRIYKVLILVYGTLNYSDKFPDLDKVNFLYITRGVGKYE